MKIFNKCICLTSRKSIMVVTGILISTLVIASVWPTTIVKEVECDEEMWVPTIEDIEYQDSMYSIIRSTQQDVDTIKKDIDKILYKLDKLEYSDGTNDSIRYVKGGKIDKRRN